MTVYDLSEREFEELRWTYFWELMDDDPDTLGDILTPDGLPDDVIREHYDGICFVEDDFFCNQ